jgi:PTS system nitrogen regulatory IIA component
MPHRLMTLEEVSRYVHLPMGEVEQLAARGEMPCVRRGPRVLFQRNDIDAWASTRILESSPRRLREYHRSAVRTLTKDGERPGALVSAMLSAGRVVEAMDARTKSSILRRLSEEAVQTGHVCDAVRFQESLVERERMGSTALPGGVAVPHPLHHEPYLLDESFLVLARLPRPVPFGAPDGQETDIFFLLCGQEEHLHLHALARVCMLCHHTDLLERVRAAASAGEIRRAVEEAENEVLLEHGPRDRR